ncbi:MAG TPA: riboflavin synthase [Micromonosporaceae bacterium]|jgi:riboflavin synthase
MFTGIVEELGSVVELVRADQSAVLRVRGPRVASDAKDGDSISVNGVCLTVVGRTDGDLGFDVMKETLDRTALASLGPGDPVNLERAVTATTRLGGHIVQGHVDGVGAILSSVPAPSWTEVRIALPPYLSRYLVEKGSVCVDGVSLTVVDVNDSSFAVSLIPTTLERTTLGRKGAAALVNLEVDVVAKYVERLLSSRTPDIGGST